MGPGRPWPVVSTAGPLAPLPDRGPLPYWEPLLDRGPLPPSGPAAARGAGPIGGALANGFTAAVLITGAAAVAGRKLAGGGLFGATSADVKPAAGEVSSRGEPLGLNAGGVGAGGMGGGRSLRVVDACGKGSGAAGGGGDGASAGPSPSAALGASMSSAGISPDAPGVWASSCVSDVSSGTEASGTEASGTEASDDVTACSGSSESPESGPSAVSSGDDSAEASLTGSFPVPGKRPGAVNREAAPSVGDADGRLLSGVSRVADRVG